MDIIAYILELLYKENRVKIAGFGEFYLKNTKAVVDMHDKNILPPTKEIGFRQDLQIVDNHLAKYIAEKESGSLFEIELDIKKTVQIWCFQLQEETPLELRNIGTFMTSDGIFYFQGQRATEEISDYFGLEKIDINSLKSNKIKSSGAFKISLCLLFLLLIPVLVLLYLVIYEKEWLFGQNNFITNYLKTVVPK